MSNTIRDGFLADAAKYFDGLEHQTLAWDWLQEQVHEDVLKEFAKKFSPPPGEVAASKAATESSSPAPTFDRSKVDWREPDSLISNFFRVREVTNGDSRRIPQAHSPQANAILDLAEELDKIREALGYPIRVTSWYRPPAVNREVGGARFSQHINGSAVDIQPLGGMDIHQFQKWLDHGWYGALGYGANKGFVHLDRRNNKGWMTGGEKGARWNY